MFTKANIPEITEKDEKKEIIIIDVIRELTIGGKLNCVILEFADYLPIYISAKLADSYTPEPGDYLVILAGKYEIRARRTRRFGEEFDD